MRLLSAFSRFVRRLSLKNLPFSQTVNREIFRIFVLEISFSNRNKNAKTIKAFSLVRQKKRNRKKEKELSSFFFAIKFFVQEGREVFLSVRN